MKYKTLLRFKNSGWNFGFSSIVQVLLLRPNVIYSIKADSYNIVLAAWDWLTAGSKITLSIVEYFVNGVLKLTVNYYYITYQNLKKFKWKNIWSHISKEEFVYGFSRPWKCKRENEVSNVHFTHCNHTASD